MSDIKNRLGPNDDPMSPLNVIVQAFEIRDKNMHNMMKNIAEAFQKRDEYILQLQEAVLELRKNVEDLQDKKVDDILLKVPRR